MAKELLSYKNFVHALAGSTGSAIAITAFFPLDTARTRLQVDDGRKAKRTPAVLTDIAQEEGIGAWYRGWFPVVSSLCCSNFVYFYAFNGLKAVCLKDESQISPATDLVIAFVAGVVNVLVTTPLWVVNTRLKLQGAKFKTEDYEQHRKPRYAGILDALQKIMNTEGITSLWSGTLPSIVLASNPAVHFMVYEGLKRYFQRMFRQKELSGVMYFLIGALAKMAATIVTYPLQVMQTRSRSGFASSQAKIGFMPAIKELMRVNGISALYKGMETKLLQTVLTAALMFLAYEKIAAFVFRLMGSSAH